MTEWSSSGCGTELLCKRFSKQGSKGNQRKGYARIQTQEKKKMTPGPYISIFGSISTSIALATSRMIDTFGKSQQRCWLQRAGPRCRLGEIWRAPSHSATSHATALCPLTSQVRGCQHTMVLDVAPCEALRHLLLGCPAAPGCEQPGPLTELNESILPHCQSRRTLLPV